MQKIKAVDKENMKGKTSAKHSKDKHPLHKPEEASERANVFKGYDLDSLELPIEARPLTDQEYRGAHSYTVLLPRDAAPCQVEGVNIVPA